MKRLINKAPLIAVAVGMVGYVGVFLAWGVVGLAVVVVVNGVFLFIIALIALYDKN